MLLGHKSTTDLTGNTNPGFGGQGGAGPDGMFNPFTLQSLQFALPLAAAGHGGSLGSGTSPQDAGGSATQTVLFAPDATKGGHGSPGGTTTSSGTTTTTSSTSGLTINITWDSSVSSAPSGFTTAVQNAAKYLETQFSDPVTINIDIGYGEVGGNALGSNTLGSSESYLSSVSYSSLLNAMTADATTSADASAVASLPSTSPVNGTFWTTTAEAKALGLASATSTALDGYIGFSSTLPFTYTDTSGVASGTYDFNGVAIHEMSEVMGRLLLTGSTVGSTANSYTPYDLFHYSAAGVRDFSASTPGYFSVNGGTTNLAAFNTTSGGDAGDWASSVTNNSFDAFSNSGVVNSVSAADLTALDVIGWNPTSGTTSPSPSPSPTPSPSPSPTPSVVAPTGVAIAPVTSALATARSATGLAANHALAVVAEVGGTAGDTYTYTLGGSGAASFALTDANNAATLATGASGVAGSTTGTAYALTLTANDTTVGTSSPAKPLEVVVGGGRDDTIQIAGLVGSANTATPTFIYGSGGNDTLNGSGMTGALLFAGGAGADTMTGGSGANHYLYGATSDSTASAMDVITNFHVGTDAIDLTGLGITLSYGGKVGGKSKLAAHSIDWLSGRGNTVVYVNTSAGSESLSAANMKIDLTGNIALTSANFLHL